MINKEKIISIELLRFISAFSILIVHYQHFAYIGGEVDLNFQRNLQPFHSVLKLFYNLGSRGVLMFWAISGFIFFFKYYELLQKKDISIKKFAVARFSRLYPLHFFTLFLVLLLQWIYFVSNDVHFVYQTNNIKNFFYHLFFISGWELEGRGFNHPIWSVSVELIVYVFYFYIFTYFKIWLGYVAVILFFLIFYKFFGFSDQSVAMCILYFFFVGIIAILKYYPFYISKNKLINNNLFNIFFIFIFLLLICVTYSKMYEKLLIFTPLNNSLSFFMSGFLICLFVYMNSFFLRYSKIFIFLGNMTYSSYLCHFPIQLTLALILPLIGYSVDYTSWELLFIYLFATYFVSYFAFRYLETPLQYFIKSRFK